MKGARLRALAGSARRPRVALLVVTILLVLLNCPRPDGTSPVVSLVAPRSGEVVPLGPVSITALATDNRAVSIVEFYVDDTFLVADTTGQADTFSCTWDASAEFPGSPHRIEVRAFDQALNSSLDTVTFSLDTIGGAGPVYHHGPLTEDEVWAPALNPHVIDDDVFVSGRHTLTILPGCRVEFARGKQLVCGADDSGAIIAKGESYSPIRFTSNSATPGPGDWRQIALLSGTMARTQFRYCRFENGGAAGSGQGTVYVSRAEVRFDHCRVSYSRDYGIVCDSGGCLPHFADNTITGCECPLRLGCEAVGRLDSGNVMTGNTRDVIEVIGGEITEPGVWHNHQVPYEIIGDIAIGGRDTAIVAIRPGVTVKLGADAQITCGDYGFHGAIVANGRPDSVITFTSALDPPSPGDWREIGLYPGTWDTTRFRYCVFEYGGRPNTSRGTVHLMCSAARFDHCLVRSSGDVGIGLYSDARLGQFTGNTITSCARYPLYIGVSAVGDIDSNNVFFGNAQDAILVSGGPVTQNAFWVNAGVPYVLDADVSVGASRSPVLTIAPGTTVQLGCQVELACGYAGAPGAIVADGTSGRITFTSAAPMPAPGDWRSISFYEAAASSSKLVNCRVEYGGSSGAGNIRINSSLPTITGDSIGHSAGWGIQVSGSPVPDTARLRAGNVFYDNALGSVGP